MTRLLALASLLLALLPGVAGATHVDGELERDLLNQINLERAERGLDPLKRDESLCELARFHSADMALGRFVASISPRAGALTKRAMAAAGVKDEQRVVTHVAAGTETAGAALARSILDPAATRVGVGVVTDGEGRMFLTEIAVADPAATPQAPTYTAPAHAQPTRMQAFLTLIRDTLVRVPAGARIAASR